MRMCGSRWIAVFAFTIFWAIQLFAVTPSEVLDDPELEARARALSAELRCVVCQGENIDGSDADVARNIRMVLREKLVEGLSDEEILDFMRVRYGDFVLLKPRFSGSGVLLWLTGPVLLLLGGLLVWRFIASAGRVPGDDDER